MRKSFAWTMVRIKALKMSTDELYRIYMTIWLYFCLWPTEKSREIHFVLKVN